MKGTILMKKFLLVLLAALLSFQLATEVAARKKKKEKKTRRGLRRILRGRELRNTYEKAKYLYASKKYTEAADVLRALITAQPDIQDSYILLGKVHEAQGKWGEAVGVYRRLRELDPNCVAAFNGVARAASKIPNMVDVAIEACKKLLEFEKNNAPRLSGIYYNLGMLYEQTGRTNDARPAYMKAIQLDTKFTLPKNNLAWMYAESKENLDEALQIINFAIELEPKSSAFYDTRGYVHYQRKEYRAAIRDYRQAIDVNATKPGYFYRISMAYYKYAEQLNPKHPFKARAAELLRSGNRAIKDTTKGNELLGPEY